MDKDKNLINDKNLHDFYNNYIHIFKGVHTTRDAYLLLERLALTGKKRELVLSIINMNKYTQQLDIETLLDAIREISTYNYREEAYAKISTILKQTSDNAQIRTLTRLANMKPLKPLHMTIKEVRDKIIETCTKICPHCKMEYVVNADTTYLICGYEGNGYDWEGCGKDWCCTCNKILCKSWSSDQLFLPFNRVHDSTCCKKHAQINNKKYPEDYCQCKNQHIRRDMEYISY